jgi:hypothetical protein
MNPDESQRAATRIEHSTTVPRDLNQNAMADSSLTFHLINSDRSSGNSKELLGNFTLSLLLRSPSVLLPSKSTA